MKKEEAEHGALRAMELKITAANISVANQGNQHVANMWAHVAKEALFFERMMRGEMALLSQPPKPKVARKSKNKGNDLNPEVATK